MHSTTQKTELTKVSLIVSFWTMAGANPIVWTIRMIVIKAVTMAIIPNTSTSKSLNLTMEMITLIIWDKTVVMEVHFTACNAPCFIFIFYTAYNTKSPSTIIWYTEEKWFESLESIWFKIILSTRSYCLPKEVIGGFTIPDFSNRFQIFIILCFWRMDKSG